MGRYIVRRLLYMLVVVLAVSIITFGLMHAVPGGPFTQEKALPAETIKVLNERYHLDDPYWKQYVDYMYSVMIPHITTTPPSNSLLDDFMVNAKVGSVWIRWMNFGPSFTSRSRTVNDIFRDNLPISGQLGVMSLLIAVIIGMPLGILAALKQNTILDYLGMGVAIFGVSVPVIVLGPIFVWIFGVSLKWLPPTGWGAKPPYFLGFLPTTVGWSYFRYALMPSIALGVGSSAIIARLTRASLLQTVREDYIRTARRQGLARTDGHYPPCTQEFAYPGRYDPRPAVCGPGYRHVRDGADLRYSRHGKIFRHEHYQPRLSGHHGYDPFVCRILGDRKPYR